MEENKKYTITLERDELKIIANNLLSYAHYLLRDKGEYFCNNKAMMLYQKICEQTSDF